MHNRATNLEIVFWNESKEEEEEAILQCGNIEVKMSCNLKAFFITFFHDLCSHWLNYGIEIPDI